VIDPPFAAAGGLPGEFRIANIFGQSFAILSRDFLPFVLLTALATSPNLLVTLAGGAESHLVRTVLAILLGLVLGSLAQAFVLYGAFQHMMGREVRAGESLAVALARFFPIIGTSICVTCAIAFGSLLLILPGITWLMMWWVAVPVCVVEGLGPIQSTRRSKELTRGHRWKLFEIFVLLIILDVVGSFILRLILAGVGAVPAAVVTWVWMAVYTAFSAIVVVTAYHDLRVLKDGVDTQQIAAGFAGG
jgi:hypothetical protein